MDAFFSLHFFKAQVSFIFGMALNRVLGEIDNLLIFSPSFWVYDINHSIFLTMINYISLLLTFISLSV